MTRSLIATVTDSHGSAVRELTKNSFAVFLDGKPASVTNVRYTLAPRRIVVLLDLSGSMADETGGGKWRIAVDAVHELLAQTPAESQIAVLTFACGIQDKFDFSQDKTAVARWLRENPDRPPQLKKKQTALFDAINEGLKLLGDAQPGDAIYAITDGVENASRATEQQTEAALLQSGVRLFALLFAQPALPNALRLEDGFLAMVQDSGGGAFGMSGRQWPGGAPWILEYPYDKANSEKVSSYTKELNAQVSGFWTLDLNAPESHGKNKVKLEITDGGGKKRKDLEIAYPRTLLWAKK